MVIKQCLLLGLTLFLQANAYRVDYFDQRIPQNCDDHKPRHWVSWPTGHSQIGKTVRYVTYTASEGAPILGEQTVALHIWYPIFHGEIFMLVRYRDYDNEWVKKQLIRRGFSHEDVFKLDDLYCHAENDYRLSSVAGKLPVIFFCPGELGTSAADYTAFCEELASHRYIVVVVENQYYNMNSVSDVVSAYEELVQYNRQQEDMFYNHIDFDRVGIMGHLHGGSLAYKLCVDDIRFNAGISLDGLPFAIDKRYCYQTKPFNIIFSEEMHNDTETYNLTNAYLYQECVPIAMTIPQLKKNGFSDLVILKDLPPYNINKHFLDLEAMTGAVDGKEALKLINEHIVAFFKKCLT